MNFEPEISIVIPVYGVEKYLEDCLSSVMNQSFQNWEAIIVDDCSKGNELAIINRYLSEDNRFILVKHESNKGLGESRNTGVMHAKGRYLFFLDSDDMLPGTILSELYNLAELQGLDLILTDHHEFVDGEDEIDVDRQFPARNEFIQQFKECNKVINWHDISQSYELMMPSVYTTTCWGKLFRLDLWRSLNCHVPLGLRMAEDFIPVKKYLFSTEKILAYPYCSILYRKRAASATKKRSTNAFDIIKSYPYAREMFDEVIPDGELDDFIERFFVQVFLEHMFTFLVYSEWYNFYKKCAPYISSMNNEKLQKVFYDISMEGWAKGSLFGFYKIIRMYLRRA